MIQLRAYQKQAIASVMPIGIEPRLIVAPTGAGKSLVIAGLVRELLNTDSTCNISILVDSRELVAQNTKQLLLLLPDIISKIGIYCDGLKQKNINQITFFSIQSLYSLIKKGQHPANLSNSIIIIDEAHMVDSDMKMYGELLKVVNRNNIIGLTATPYRENNAIWSEDEGFLFKKINYEITPQTLIEQRFLVPLKSRFLDLHYNTEGVKKTQSDYNAKDLRLAIHKQEKNTEDFVRDFYEKTADLNSVMVFCVDVAHAITVDGLLNALQPDCSKVVVQDTPARDIYINMFKAKKYKYIVSVGILTKGFDAPAVDGIVLLRPTQSVALYLQMLGRGMRPNEDKSHCLLFDYTESINTFGYPQNFTTQDIITFSTNKRKKLSAIAICKDCYTINDTKAPHCIECGVAIEKAVKKSKSDGNTDYLDKLTFEKPKIWEIKRIDSHITKKGERAIKLSFAGEDGWLTEYLSLEGKGLYFTKKKLLKYADSPQEVEGFLQQPSLQKLSNLVGKKFFLFLKKNGDFINITEVDRA